jgi:uncharacterized protein YkwD
VHRTRRAPRGIRSVLLAAVALAATLLPFGSLGALTPAAITTSAMNLNAPVVGMAATPSGHGYWRVASDGGIFTAGDAHFYGSTGGMHLNQPIVGMAATPTGHGYWLVASDGGIFTFGDAHFYGSTGGMHLNQPIVGMAATRHGDGYWLIARDGGVFTFGDAHFYGSAGAMRLSKPIVGGVATPTGHGYWFVAADGGVFTFGDARFHGSTGGTPQPAPVVGMAAADDGNGYLLLSANGAVHHFGSAAGFGSAVNACPGAPAVAIATSPGAAGYWISFADARAYALSAASKPPTCAPAASTPTGAAASDLYTRLNDERRARGLAPLAWNTTLAAYAANWSENMAANGFRHSDIGALLGPFDYVGENIAAGTNVPASALHIAWMGSQGHRDNMLSPGFTSVGVGVYCRNGTMWATTEFGRLSSAGPPPSYAGNTPPDPVARADTDDVTC